MKTIISVLILLVGGITGCSPYRVVRNQSDNSVIWSGYRTFAFIDTNHVEAVPDNAYQFAIEQVKRAVAAELANRGYRQMVNSEVGAQADLLVNIGGIVNEKTQTRPTTIYEAPRYIGQQRYHWQSQEVPVRTYKEGTLNVHIVDAQRNNLLWDAAVSSVLRKGNVTPDQIQAGVSRLFTKFPGNRS